MPISGVNLNRKPDGWDRRGGGDDKTIIVLAGDKQPGRLFAGGVPDGSLIDDAEGIWTEGSIRGEAISWMSILRTPRAMEAAKGRLSGLAARGNGAWRNDIGRAEMHRRHRPPPAKPTTTRYSISRRSPPTDLIARFSLSTLHSPVSILHTILSNSSSCDLLFVTPCPAAPLTSSLVRRPA